MRIQIAMDCSLFCSSGERWATLEANDLISCLLECVMQRYILLSTHPSLLLLNFSFLIVCVPYDLAFSIGNLLERDINEQTAIEEPSLIDSSSMDTSGAPKTTPSTAITMNIHGIVGNHQSPINSPPHAMPNGNLTSHAAQSSRIGEVNGVLSWTESAYRSFWFFAWTLVAIAIAIGTQML